MRPLGFILSKLRTSVNRGAGGGESSLLVPDAGSNKVFEVLVDVCGAAHAASADCAFFHLKVWVEGYDLVGDEILLRY